MACSEQLKVLSKLASTGTRLADSIFKSYDDHNQLIGNSSGITMTSQKQNYEQNLSQLIDQKIKEIYYWEIDYDTDSPEFECGEYHSLDLGVSFITETNEEFYIIWDKQYFQFDIKFSKGSFKSEMKEGSNPKVHNVSKHSLWIELINQPIKTVESIWYDETNAPGDLVITFKNDQIVIFSSTEIRSYGTIFGSADHISVFFSAESARKFGVLLP